MTPASSLTQGAAHYTLTLADRRRTDGAVAGDTLENSEPACSAMAAKTSWVAAGGQPPVAAVERNPARVTSPYPADLYT